MAHPASSKCHNCGTEISDRLLACPFCKALVHGSRLKELASQAKSNTEQGNTKEAILNWREAMTLLPEGSQQSLSIAARLEPLVAELNSNKTSGIPKNLGRYGAALSALVLLAWKFKVVIVFFLAKGKLLLLGLTKASTLFSMVLSLGVYWVAFGWKFALGLVISIYIHEIGHVFALRQLGIRASAPMFIPGFGAVVRMHEYPASPAEDARVGLAGPVWGLSAAIAAWLVYLSGGGAIWGAIAQVGAWINLFNLMPVWQLDGHRGFRAMSRQVRVFQLLLVSAAALFFVEGLMWLIVIVGVFTLREQTPEHSDPRAVLTYSMLILVLGYMTTLQVLPQ